MSAKSTTKEEGTMNDGFTKLSEASFAEDWDSPEDEVYDIAAREQRLEELLAAAREELELDASGSMPLDTLFDGAKLDIAAAALDLARGLRKKGDIVADKGWHLRECALAFDWLHYQIESPCTCESDCKALADWDQLLRGLGDG